MKPVRWGPHALRNLTEREIDSREAAGAVAAPDRVRAGHSGRLIYVRRYQDEVLGAPMLLCLVVEDLPNEVVVVTAYKSSRFARYLGRVHP
jgi:hypothetical protein